MNAQSDLPLDKQIKIAQDINSSGILKSEWGELGLTETKYYWYKFVYALFWRTLCPCPDGRFLKLRNWAYNLTGKIAYRYHKNSALAAVLSVFRTIFNPLTRVGYGRQITS